VTTVRRRILRQTPPRIAPDARRAARLQRRRAELTKSRAALRRWLTWLKRAANAVSELHQRIGRLETSIANGG
jgi:hypothetical protein